MTNFFEIDTLGETEEAFMTFLETNNVKIERIVSRGQTSEKGFYYNQEEGEWIIVLEGEAELGYPDGSTTLLKKGDTLYLPPHKRHRVNKTTNPTLWLAVFIKNEKNEQN